MVRNTRTLGAVVVALVGMAMFPGSLRAQLSPDLQNAAHVGVGYMPNVPVTPLGFSVLAVSPKLFGGAGVQASVRFTTDSPGNSPFFMSGMTVADAEIGFGDLLFEEKSDWLAVNLALVYALSGELALYGGAGYAKEDRYREYFDESRTRGDFGFYWVEDPEASGTRVNVLGGLIFRLTRAVYFQIGAESAPRGGNVGIVIALPL